MDDLCPSQRMRWDVPAKVSILTRAKDGPASPDPVLELACFAKPPRVSFENVKVGTARVKSLRLLNPGDDIETVVLEKFPDSESGFAMEGMHPDHTFGFSIHPQEEVEIKVSWKPVRPGNSRHLVTFRWIGGQKLQFVLLGSAYDPNAGKKKKAKRFAPRKALQPSHKLNLPRPDVKVLKAKERLAVGENATSCKSPNVQRLVEIAPDTPSRRSTFTVTQSAFEESGNDSVDCDNKENVPIPSKDQIDRETFNVDRKAPTEANQDYASKKEAKDVQKDFSFNGKWIDKQSALFESAGSGKIFDGNRENDLSIESNTFHESEIRLSSSPIKWCIGREPQISSKYKRELHPGQVVLNGEVKHGFIPYPSFDNTDTFLNMEMSTATNKDKVVHQDKSLSFDSAASSLFTITHEEKFFPSLEPVQESSDLIATPKAFSSQSKTLTNDTCAATPLPTDNGWVSAVKEAKDVSFSITRVERFRPDLEPLEEASNALETPKAFQSTTLTNFTCIATPVAVGKGALFEGIKEGSSSQPKNSIEHAVEDASESKSAVPSNVLTMEEAENKAIIYSSQESLAQQSIKDLQETEICQDEKGEPCHDVQQNRPARKIKNEDFGQESKEAIDKLGSKSKGGEKIVQSRYMNAKMKKRVLPGKKEAAGQPTKERVNVADAKFKGINLPQKRRNETVNSTAEKSKPRVAVKKLRLIKPQEKIAKHPMPYASKNMYYDERWIEKQERGFKNWLNFVLTPPDDDVETRAIPKRGIVSLESDSVQPVAPTKETLSFRTYAAKRRMAKLRRDACMLYQTDMFASLIHKLEREIEHGRLAIRLDRHVNADLGVRKQISDMLLSFNTLWLRISLEVVYGEIIPMGRNDDASSLSHFIRRRLLGNPDIAVNYSHASVPGLFKPGYYEALAQFTLKKLLLVIIYLDKAKNSRLISHDPCLFNKDSQFKSIREMLIIFSRDYLQREGDIVKHLTYLGYTVSHVQTPLHEYDFGVSSLSVDLRDGLRLVRVVELLTQNWNLSAKLRVPAVSRLQKIHNVELAFQGLKERSLDLKNESNIDARLIVDGHREKTLSLLWKIIFHFQVDLLLDEKQLRDEIKYLERKAQLMNIGKGLYQTCPSKTDEDENFADQIYNQSKKLSLLLKWCRLVGRIYGVNVDNFTVSFSDGRALCYLLSHYHPALLTKEEVRDETTVTSSMSQGGDCDEDEIDDSLIGQKLTKSRFSGTGANMMVEALLANEKHNHGLFCEKVKEIGASPSMILASDMSNTIPDEKVVIAYISFLCSRLLDLREEIRAARCIQMAWRHYQLHRRRKEHQVFVKAATKMQAIARGFLVRQMLKRKVAAITLLQKNIRSFLRKRRQDLRDNSATKIQQWYRASKVTRTQRHSYLETKTAAMKVQRIYRRLLRIRNERKQDAARCIQAAWKRYHGQKSNCRRVEAAVSLQKIARGYLCRRRYLMVRRATLVLQSSLRAHIMKTKAVKEYKTSRKAIVSIQRCWRRKLSERAAAKVHASIVIQTGIRSFICQRAYRSLKESTIKVQSFVRGYQQQRRYEEMKSAAIYLQRQRRSVLVTRRAQSALEIQRNACVTIQKLHRGRVARREFVSMKLAAMKLQAVWRGKSCRRRLTVMQQAACLIQNEFRAWRKACVAREEFLQLRSSVIRIQAAYRGRVQKQSYYSLRQAIVNLQAVYRGNAERKNFLRLRSAAISLQRHRRAVVEMRVIQERYKTTRDCCVKIQAWYRGLVCERRYSDLKECTVFLQSVQRRNVAVKHFNKMKTSVIVIQRRYRAMRLSQAAQVHYLVTKAAVIKIQSVYRGQLVRKELRKLHGAALVMQSVFRMRKTRLCYHSQKQAAICIQRQYRASKLTQLKLSEYKSMRSAAISLQAAFRGHLIRRRIHAERSAATMIKSFYKGCVQKRRYKEMKQAACVIQRYTRGWIARTEFLTIKFAVIRIQRFYMGHLQTKASVTLYRKKLASVVTIQAFCRGFLCRKLIQKHRAACKLQAVIRGHIQRKRYLKLLNVVVKLQKAVRNKIEYKRRERAAICIHQHWKAYRLGLSQRAQYLQKRQSCIKLQSFIRRWIQMRYFAQFKAAALTIQRRFRAKRAMVLNRGHFQKLKRMSILIQSVFRMHSVRKQFKAKRRATVVLQKHIRDYIANERLIRETKAAIVIQHRYVAYRKMREQRSWYFLQRNSAVALQSQLRRFLARKRFTSMKHAAVKIQAWYRMVRVKRYFAQKKNAVLVIQRRYRALVAGEMQQVCYHLMRGAAITLQACIRGFLLRKRFLEKRTAAIRLQAAWRRYACLRQYKKTLRAVMKIQRRIKANALARTERSIFIQKRCAAIAMQRRFRELLVLQRAVVKAQTRFRMLRERRKFVHERECCITIQRCYRKYAQRKQAAIALQAAWKMHVERMTYLRKRAACVKLQAAFRRVFAKRSYMLQLGAAITIQRRFKAHAEGSVARRGFLNAKKSCVLIQAQVRSWMARKTFLKIKYFAVVVQRQFRAQLAMKQGREQFIELKSATIKMQAFYRGYKARILVDILREQKRIEEAEIFVRELEIMLLKNRSAIVIQNNFRRFRAKSKYTALRNSAVKLQRFYRSYLLTKRTRNEFLVARSSAVTIQRALRIYSARKCLDELRKENERLNNAAFVIQSAFKGLIERKSFLRMKYAATAIQRIFRLHLLTKQIRGQFLLQKSCAVKIQSFYRAYKARTLLRYLKLKRDGEFRAAICIQKCIRGYWCRRDFQTVREAAVFIQRTYRGNREMERVRREFIELRQSTVKIQRSFRSYVMRKTMANRIARKQMRREKCIIIQRSFRKYRLLSARKAEIRRRKLAIIKIQRCFRRHLAKKQIAEFHAALKIQRAYRKYKAEETSKRCVSATKIQSVFRGYMQQKRYAKLKAATVLLQKRTREVLEQRRGVRETAAAIFIQQWYRSVSGLRRDMALHKMKRISALRIQSYWRGYLVRRSIVDRKMVRARERIESANSEVTEPKKLCNRTKSALSYLLNCRNVSTIYEALKTLEVSTRLSTKCCERLVEDNALPVILQIIRNCNRSLPSMEQIHMALLVLTNVAKCTTTYMAIVDERDSLHLIMELMTNFREKMKIFPNCCKLLCILCKDPQIARYLKGSHMLAKKVASLHSLIDRKAQIELKRANGTARARRDGKTDPIPIFDQLHSIKQLVNVLSLA